MAALRRWTAVAGCALVTAGVVVAAPTATAAARSCGTDDGAATRYLVLFPGGTPRHGAVGEIAAACGRTAGYYPEIAVAVARSSDPAFATRFGIARVSRATPASAPGRSHPAMAVTGRPAGGQWDMRMIGVAAAHRITHGNRTAVVGVLDSGVDPGHPALRHAMAPALSVGCASGVPERSARAWRPSGSSHGTHVAGTIAGNAPAAGFTGVAPGVRIASVRVVDGSGAVSPAAAVCGLVWPGRHHFAVANHSYTVSLPASGCTGPAVAAAAAAVRRAARYARSHGVLNVAAAGNDGADLAASGAHRHCPALPAALPGVLAVSAVDATGLKAAYSDYGLGIIALTAPGGTGGSRCVPSTVPGGYGDACGTSMAAPHVAGVAALLASLHPGATPARLARLLQSTARPVRCPADYDLAGTGAQDAYCTGYRDYNAFYGHGMVDAAAAVTGTLNPAAGTVPGYGPVIPPRQG